MMTVRKACPNDLAALTAIYEETHTLEEQGMTATGWIRGVYPTGETARRAIEEGEMYVLEEDGVIAACARFNRHQEDVYALVPWQTPAEPDEVLVMHTLVVSPAHRGRGCAHAFAAWYEEEARRLGCRALRIDTNARNAAARRLYASLGYRESAIVPCKFNGIPDVALVCLEKSL